MPFRITSNATKTGYVVASYLIALLIALAVVLTAGLPTAAAVWAVLLLTCVLVAVRIFRGENEALEAPRAWWRMSARPTSGFVFGAVFLLQGASLAASSLLSDATAGRANAASYLVVAALNLVVGAFFVHSSIRLHGAQRVPASGSDGR